MKVALGLVANVFNEVNALPGWLETHLPFFDDVRVLHAGPQGDYSDDGTIELLERWRVPITYTRIDDGFGMVRTMALRISPCDYVMILDADERFYPVCEMLRCRGESTPHSEADRILRAYDFREGKRPDWSEVAKLGSGLLVEFGSLYHQGQELRAILEQKRPDVVLATRRHWHEFGFRRPTQNWETEPDWQARIVRNDGSIYFDAGTAMHERLVGANRVYNGDGVMGPFFDHFHFAFKRMEEKQRAHDVAIYDAIHEGKTPPNSIKCIRCGGEGWVSAGLGGEYRSDCPDCKNKKMRDP